jgi:Family of unknown function (DUF6428)
MQLSTLKTQLQILPSLRFVLPNGQPVPSYFHVTEVGMTTKDFIDCGGKVRQEKAVNFQLWEDGDVNHVLAPQKLLNIIALSEKVLNIEDLEIEVEYQQSDTIGKYGLEFDGQNLQLTTKQTACLAMEQCGLPTQKLKTTLSTLTSTTACCTPGGSCC